MQLVNSAYRGEGAKAGWTTEADLLDGLRTDEVSLTKTLEGPGASILVSVNEQDEIIGCVYLQQNGSVLYLGMLTVKPNLQAKGIGKQLLNAANAHALESGCSKITMTVISVRAELIAWYERHGYIKTGETKPFPKDPSFGIPKQDLEFLVLEKII